MPAGFLLWALAAAWPSGAAGGVTYGVTDDRGVVHFSNAHTALRRHLIVYSLHRPSPQVYVYTIAHRSYDPLIRRAAHAYGVEPALVKAIIAAESRFNPLAVSEKGAQGLMQLMPRTAHSLAVRNPFEPDESVFGGVQYLRRMLDRYGNVTEALAAYNAGPGTVDRYGGTPPYPETQAYIQRVLDYRHRYRAKP